LPADRGPHRRCAAGRVAARLALTAILTACAASASAQAPSAPSASSEYRPEPGQPGKDVVWVPMPEERIEKLLDLARVGPKDYVIDLGSGDGRVVIAAAKRGAQALGVEFNPDLVALSQRDAQKAGVADRAAFVQGDMFEADLSHATVVTLFLFENLNIRLRPKLLQLRPGTRIAANTFRMGDWEPDASQTGGGCFSFCDLYLWIVPARVAGVWRTPQGELRLRQQYQMLDGTLGAAPLALGISEGRVTGSSIRFSAGDTEYRGRLIGDGIEGTATDSGTRPWRATRASP